MKLLMDTFMEKVVIIINEKILLKTGRFCPVFFLHSVEVLDFSSAPTHFSLFGQSFYMMRIALIRAMIKSVNKVRFHYY